MRFNAVADEPIYSVRSWAEVTAFDGGLLQLPSQLLIKQDPRLAAYGYAPAEQWVPYKLTRRDTPWSLVGAWHKDRYTPGVNPPGFTESVSGGTITGGGGASVVFTAPAGATNAQLYLSSLGPAGTVVEMFILSKSKGFTDSGNYYPTMGAGYYYQLGNAYCNFQDAIRDLAGGGSAIYRGAYADTGYAEGGSLLPPISTLTTHFHFIKPPGLGSESITYWQLPEMNDSHYDIWRRGGTGGQYKWGAYAASDWCKIFADGYRAATKSELTIDYMAVYTR